MKTKATISSVANPVYSLFEEGEVMEYKQSSHDVLISVRPAYLPEESMPHDDHYIWSYHIRMENKGERSIQLLNRYWRIVDASGVVEEVRGPGVVGKQPVLRPGEVFEYASGTHLRTASGMMQGYYDMQDEDGNRLNVAIPAFSLDSEEQLTLPN